MRLVDITSENWEDVIFLTTNETITIKGSDAPYEAKGIAPAAGIRGNEKWNTKSRI